MAFSHILIPLDGTETAERVIPVAHGLADPQATRITLLHVLERSAPARKHGERHLQEAEAAEAYLRGLASRALADHAQVDWHTHEDAVADLVASLVDHTRELRPDLVVMSTHGNQWLKEWLRGNLAQRWLHAATRRSVGEAWPPILLVQPDTSGRVVFPFRGILVPLDGSDAHEQGLEPAARLANQLRIPIVLYTAIAPEASVRGKRGAAAALLPRATEEVLRIAEKEARAHLEGHVQELCATGLAATGRVERVEPATGIAQTAADVKADLIVLGTHALTAAGAFWAGSVTPRLLQTAHTSFLLTPGSGG